MASSSTSSTVVAVSSVVVALSSAIAAGVYLLRTSTRKTTTVRIAIQSELSPTKVISEFKDKESPYCLDARSPLLPLPHHLFSYLDRWVAALRVEDAAYSFSGSKACLTFRSMGCECQLTYEASAADPLLALGGELTASGPVGPVYVVSGLGISQVAVRMLLLKFKLESAAKAV